jgi:hypothetical protein
VGSDVWSVAGPGRQLAAGRAETRLGLPSLTDAYVDSADAEKFTARASQLFGNLSMDFSGSSHSPGVSRALPSWSFKSVEGSKAKK